MCPLARIIYSEEFGGNCRIPEPALQIYSHIKIEDSFGILWEHGNIFFWWELYLVEP